MRSITVVCLMMIAAFASVTAYAEDKKQAPVVKTTGIEKSFLEGHDTFRQKHDDAHEIARIKNRAQTAPVANNGYTRYKYTYIPKFVDCAHIGEAAGNIAGARGVYNVTVVSDPAVLAEACPGLIGNVTTTGGDVTNYVNIEGNVTGVGQEIAIGNTIVTGSAGNVSNTVTIEGNIRSTETINIGNTIIRNGNVQNVTNRVSVQGNIKSGEDVSIGGIVVGDASAKTLEQSVIIDGNITAE